MTDIVKRLNCFKTPDSSVIEYRGLTEDGSLSRDIKVLVLHKSMYDGLGLTSVYNAITGVTSVAYEEWDWSSVLDTSTNTTDFLHGKERYKVVSAYRSTLTTKVFDKTQLEVLDTTVEEVVSPDSLSGYYNFDGVDDYITVPQINLVVGDKIKLRTIYAGDITGYQYLLDSSTSPNTYIRVSWDRYVRHSGNLDVTVTTATGVPVIGQIPVGVELIITAKVIGVGSVTTIGSRYDEAEYFNGSIYELGFTAKAGDRHYPMNDGWRTSQSIWDMLGDGVASNGIASNFDEANWNPV